jgi:alpha-1,2-mannosyltransferase
MRSRLLRLLVFVIATTAGVSLVLCSLGVPLTRTGVDPLIWFVEGRQGGDSWRPSLSALEVADTIHLRSAGLYEKVFFQAKVPHKGFQYPPTALLSIRAARAAAGTDAYTALAVANWLSIPVLILASLSLFRPSAPQSPGSRVLLVLVVVFATLLFYPAMRAYRNGQMQAWINALFALALAAHARNAQASAGACLAFAAMIKPQMGLLALWAAIRRQSGMLAAFVLVLGVGVTATAFWLGLAPFFGYLNVLKYIAQRGETFYPNQSVNGFMNRLVENGSSVDFGDSMPEPNSLVATATGLSSLLFLALALIPPRGARGNAPSPVDLAFMGLVATLASPIAWEHHYGVLLPIFALLARSWLEGELQGNRLWLTAIAWMLAANSWEAANVFAATPLRFLQSTLLVGVLCLAIALRLPWPEGEPETRP